MNLVKQLPDLIGRDTICPNKYWVNDLAYIINISLMRNCPSSVYGYLESNLMLYGCQPLIKKYSSSLKKVLRKDGNYYYQLLLLCNLTNNENAKIKSELINSNNSLLKILLGDSITEKKLFNEYNSSKKYDEKIKIIEIFRCANTNKSTQFLLQMLDDTTLNENYVTKGIKQSLREPLFKALSYKFCMDSLFSCELNNALENDKLESEIGGVNVNKYFCKVIQWVKNKYNINLHNLNKYNYFTTGYDLPVDMW